jgi:hypothetical protein
LIEKLTARVEPHRGRARAGGYDDEIAGGAASGQQSLVAERAITVNADSPSSTHAGAWHVPRKNYSAPLLLKPFRYVDRAVAMPALFRLIAQVKLL